MKLLGSGIDIVQVDRIGALHEKYGTRFVEKILHDRELDELRDHLEADSFLAKRFAVKEATAKALGLGIGKSLSFKDIYVEHDELGKPELVFTQECRLRLKLEKVNALLTIADEKAYAVAHVLMYSEG